MPGPFTVSLDVGSSSVRALLFDAQAHQMEGFGAQVPYRIHTTPDGGAEVDGDQLAELAIDCLDELHRQVAAAGHTVAAVAGSAFWHSFLGVDVNGKPTLPILHLLDTRCGAYVSRTPDTHSRTGCMPHSSYWPAKLLWLAEARADQMRATTRWLSFPEYLSEKLFGHARASISMLSATGLWNQNANDYDAATLEALPIRRDQLPDPATFDEPQTDPLAAFAQMWPAFRGAKWFPALGDGACNNLGSGCTSRERASLMVGTTGAMRLVVEAASIEVPRGLWCYRVDRKRFVIGGALSNGGEVVAWAKRTLQLPKDDLGARLEAAVPGSHMLTVLPFFSGERTPYWRSDLRAAITGLSFATEPFDILRANLEAISLGFAEIYRLLEPQGKHPEVIASGGGLLKNPGLAQMMADALDRPITLCTELESSCRGAALWAMERCGVIQNIADLPASHGATFEPRSKYRETYQQLRDAQHALYAKLFGPAT